MNRKVITWQMCAELEAYAGVISALRAQGDLTKDKKDLLGELTKVLRYHVYSSCAYGAALLSD